MDEARANAIVSEQYQNYKDCAVSNKLTDVGMGGGG
jgi:hypothetical protein